MHELNMESMKKVKGGAALSVGNALNAVARLISNIFSIGQAIGSALRRTSSGSYCNY